MEFLTTLWLPILLSAVAVFLVSAVMHMLLPWHRSDYKQVPDDDAVRATMRTAGLEPGHYFFPNAGDYRANASDEMTGKYDEGPVGFMTILPSGRPGMGGSLVQWFLFSLVVSVFAAYIARLGLADGAPYLTVFRVTGAVATLGYAVTYFPDSIWKGLSWTITLKNVVDGVVYGLVTAGVFGWLWPTM